MSVKVKDLTKIYGNQRAVDRLTFETSQGQILGFLGPNGAGKTTTMKMLTGYISPSEGTAEICGYDIIKDPIEVRRNIGYLPEHNPLYKEMYVKEYLRFVAGLYKMKNATSRISDLIEMTGLEKEQHKRIGALSKGYRQRVGLAQAMFNDPQVLILDEPTSGLDMNQLVDIRQLIKELGKEKTVIFSTHIMQEVQALCDRVLIINNGSLVADDPIEDLEKRIKGDVIIHLEIKEQKVDFRSFEDISGVHAIKSLGDGKLEIRSDANTDVRPDIFQCVVDNKWTILEMRKESLSVEYIFRKLTKEATNV